MKVIGSGGLDERLARVAEERSVSSKRRQDKAAAPEPFRSVSTPRSWDELGHAGFRSAPAGAAPHLQRFRSSSAGTANG
jgi:hypothetical protein